MSQLSQRLSARPPCGCSISPLQSPWLHVQACYGTCGQLYFQVFSRKFLQLVSLSL